MKIGLLTHTPAQNYGGILQAVALYSYLTEVGHDVTLVDKVHVVSFWKRVASIFLEIVPFQNFKNKRSTKIKREQLKAFIRSNLPTVSGPIKTITDLKCLVESQHFDAVIVGSDQVWRYQFINDGNYEVYFLNFEVDFNLKKISYAASFGKGEWEAPSEILTVTDALSKFDAVSVREKGGVAICRDVFGLENCECVLDPTMLVGADFYEKFLPSFSIELNEKKLVTYILDTSDEKSKTISTIIGHLEEEDGMPYTQTNLSEMIYGRFHSVEEWLWQIKNADFVVTDSFHGVAFCLLFGKEFIVIGNTHRGIDRIESLLETLEVCGRLIVSEKQLSDQSFVPIDYQKVSCLLNELRHLSSVFLSNSLSGRCE